MRTLPTLAFLILILSSNATSATAVKKVENSNSKQNVQRQMDAASCSTVSLNQDLGPTRNQQDNSNCYAQVASDMVTQQIRSEQRILTKDRFQASALQLQYLYNKANSKLPSSQYGHTFGALQALRKSGNTICSNGYLENGVAESSSTKSKSFSAHKFNARTTLESIQNLNKDYSPYADCRGAIGYIPKPVGFYWNDDISTHNKATQSAKRLQVDSGLGQNKIVGIALDMKWIDGTSGKHAVSIVGRQNYKGECWYEVRNSWGDNACRSLTQDMPKICSDGGFWVKAKDLIPKITETNYLPANLETSSASPQRAPKGKNGVN